MEQLKNLVDNLPDDLAKQALTHSSWVKDRADSYGRLAFLGDSVVELAITANLFPRLDAKRYGQGKLTKIRAQAVSGRSCRAVAERLKVPKRMRKFAPAANDQLTDSLLKTERVLASVIEAIIGACLLHYGYEKTAKAVVEAFQPEMDNALESSTDFKSTLQERLARDGSVVAYKVIAEEGPPHARSFEVTANISGKQVAVGIGRSKKEAEQAAAALALEGLSK